MADPSAQDVPPETKVVIVLGDEVASRRQFDSAREAEIFCDGFNTCNALTEAGAFAITEAEIQAQEKETSHG